MNWDVESLSLEGTRIPVCLLFAMYDSRSVSPGSLLEIESQLPKDTNESEFAFNKIPGVYTFHSFLICSTIDRLLGPFHVLATVNNGVINMKVQTSLTHSVFVSFECISRSRIAGSYGRSTFFF